MKAFLFGARIGAYVCNTTVYSFFAGVFFGFTVFVDNVKKNLEQSQRRDDWKARAEAGSWKPGT